MTSSADSLLALLWSDPGREWTAPDLMASLGLTNERLYNLLPRLIAEGQLDRPRRGRYCIDPTRHTRPASTSGTSDVPEDPIAAEVARLGVVERHLWALLSPDHPLSARQVACRYGITYSLAQRHLDALVAYDVADVRGGHYTRRSA